ncbi:ATPase associated with various cellular activities AAA_5 [Conexibacter woesei DSM 14684]|uniref:ATPase associated with various cellular activities AAA_5 n=2 Tax=Conexibacter TaxID=191494 RepID=D3F9G0_CONWI|nr:ATPase associated with various cellular activities AAA_5 [Conexibacter woesei DSM 14684]
MQARGIMLAKGLVARVMRAWLVRDIAVLVGAPGTGKTTFAREFAEACRSCIPDLRDKAEVLVDPDFDAARLLGYLDLAGDYQATGFARQVVLTWRPQLPQIVLLEEWNTAQVEAYLGQILHAVESEGAVTLPDGSQPRIPLDTLFLATCNSVRDEPDTRLPVSRPTKRRATVIEMPNILYDAWKEDGRSALVSAADEYLEYSRQVIADREEEAPTFDQLRASLLGQLTSVEDLPEIVLETLLDIVEFLFESQEGQQFMTIGLLVDILEELAYAGDDAAEALGWCVCGKLLQQVTRFSVAKGLADKAGSLPNAEEIERAVAAMDLRDGTVSQLL